MCIGGYSSYLLIFFYTFFSQDKSSSPIGSTQCCKIVLSPLSFFFFTAGSTSSVDSVSTARSIGGGHSGDKLSNFETAFTFIW